MNILRLPTLSFIIPVYNVEPYVAQCLESIITQWNVFPGSEIIVVNDGTRDHSMEVVERVLADIPRVRILNQENQGLSMARNHGMSVATGDYIWLIDSDDWLETDALLTLKDAMMEHPDMDLYVTGLNWTFPSGKIHSDIKPSVYPVMDGVEYARTFPKGASQRYVQKRTMVETHHLHFVPGIIHEDGPYGTILAAWATKIKILPKSVYGYRQREGSIMQTLSIRSGYDCLKGHRLLMEFCDKELPEERKPWFKDLAFGMIMAAINFTCHLRGSAEYRKFEQEGWGYVLSQVKEISRPSGMGTCRAKLLKLFPNAYLNGYIPFRRRIRDYLCEIKRRFIH